jgi:hypothetical protein
MTSPQEMGRNKKKLKLEAGGTGKGAEGTPRAGASAERRRREGVTEKRRRWRDATAAFSRDRRAAAGDEESASVLVASIREGARVLRRGKQRLDKSSVSSGLSEGGPAGFCGPNSSVWVG